MKLHRINKKKGGNEMNAKTNIQREKHFYAFSCFIFQFTILSQPFRLSTHIFYNARLLKEEKEREKERRKRLRQRSIRNEIKRFCNKEMYNRYESSLISAQFLHERKIEIDFEPKINYYSTFKRNFKSTITSAFVPR